MPLGCRQGYVTKDVLVARLVSAVPEGGALENKPARVLLGHAIFHGVVTANEVNETTERVETTIPCYLFSYVEDPLKRQAIEKYVLAASQLFRRGTIIANLVAIETLGAHTDLPVGSRPRFDMASSMPFGELADFYMEQDVRSSETKHVFLPERWPTLNVQRSPRVQAVLSAYGDRIPRLPDWQIVMKPCGWDNVINRMATKFLGNLKVQAMKNLRDAVVDYVGIVSLYDEGSRSLVAGMIKGQDWEMVCRLRTTLGVRDDDVTFYPPKKTPFSRGVLLLHLFIVKFGKGERSYLPISTRGQKYGYLDTKITTSLFAQAVRQSNKRRKEAAAEEAREVKAARLASGEKRPRKKKIETNAPPIASPPTLAPPPVDGEGDMEEDVGSTSVGELLGLTEESFKRRRKELRKVLRLQTRKAHRAERPGAKKTRLAKAKRRWANIGMGSLPKGCRIDSVETDGVGLRLCVKTKIDMRHYIRRVPPPVMTDDGASMSSGAQLTSRKKKAKTRGLPETPYFTPKDASDDRLPRPLVLGVDTGRAKLFVAAISKSAVQKPTSVVFTRHRYYYEMGHTRHRRWDLARREQNPAINAALLQLSESGGLRNCDPEKWAAYLNADQDNDAVLDAEYVLLVERARWRMRMFRSKKRSLDRAVNDLIEKATVGERMDRPLVFGIGDGGFPSSGPGELPAPTSALAVAFKRGLRRHATKGRVVVVLVLDEFRTTMCCCACGSVTTPTQVEYLGKDGTRQWKASNRLRACTTCNTTGKLRDRDVRAARNITWPTYNKYYGQDRPEYLKRGRQMG
eukprot:gene17719-24078_t